MARVSEHAGYMANYYRWFGTPEAPFGWYYDLLALWAHVSTDQRLDAVADPGDGADVLVGDQPRGHPAAGPRRQDQPRRGVDGGGHVPGVLAARPEGVGFLACHRGAGERPGVQGQRAADPRRRAGVRGGYGSRPERRDLSRADAGSHAGACQRAPHVQGQGSRDHGGHDVPPGADRKPDWSSKFCTDKAQSAKTRHAFCGRYSTGTCGLSAPTSPRPPLCASFPATGSGNRRSSPPPATETAA